MKGTAKRLMLKVVINASSMNADSALDNLECARASSPAPQAGGGYASVMRRAPAGFVLLALACGCSRPFLARDGTLVFQEKGAHGASVLTANGLEFAYLEEGPPDGPLALCLHGFPDSAHTWRYLLPELARAGFQSLEWHVLYAVIIGAVTASK